jgi:hypothetical protein
MSFIVTWSKIAHDQMGALILALPRRRKEFSSALKRISSDLQSAPLSQGESREGADRIWFVGDLIVVFRVDEESEAVEVASVHLRRPR